MGQRGCDIPELENQASSIVEPTNVTKDMERTKKDQKQNHETSAAEEEKGRPDHSQERQRTPSKQRGTKADTGTQGHQRTPSRHWDFRESEQTRRRYLTPSTERVLSQEDLEAFGLSVEVSSSAFPNSVRGEVRPRERSYTPRMYAQNDPCRGRGRVQKH